MRALHCRCYPRFSLTFQKHTLTLIWAHTITHTVAATARLHLVLHCVTLPIYVYDIRWWWLPGEGWSQMTIVLAKLTDIWLMLLIYCCFAGVSFPHLASWRGLFGVVSSSRVTADHHLRFQFSSCHFNSKSNVNSHGLSQSGSIDQEVWRGLVSVGGFQGSWLHHARIEQRVSRLVSRRPSALRMSENLASQTQLLDDAIESLKFGDLDCWYWSCRI